VDINLTGPIASQIASNLTQPWYSPIMNAVAGIIGGVIALAGVWVAQKNEARKSRRDERKNTYLDIINIILKAAKEGDIDSEVLGRCVMQLQLLGSKKILIKMAPITEEMLTEKDIAKRMVIQGEFMEEIIPLMRKDLLLDKDDEVSDHQRTEAEQYWRRSEKKIDSEETENKY
jgi:hypothetical protein